MKKLGKNKKKQWRNCYKNLEGDLDEAKKKERILQEGFTLKNEEKRQKPAIVKGAKDSAKAFRDIPSAPDAEAIRRKRIIRKNRRSRGIDLWECETARHSGEVPTVNIPVPAGGQSYNPSISDHYTLLSTLATSESRAVSRELKTARFLNDFKGAKKHVNPLEEAQSFLQILAGEKPINTQTPLEEEEEVSLRKPKTRRRKNRMAVELENIPKILKEIKREKQARAVKKARLTARKARRCMLSKMDTDVAFQMPNELVPSLRKLTPEGNLLREIEKRKNKCPRARRTLGVTKNTKAFVRRR
ncbi:unnamed protein product [Calicophoron daubneyi]|uniref:Ribosome biogenesis protein NOP53 n=1 Tax=Calicophoron daubneyi TaxID=300641 RepID=A0AAV2TNY6_CALDB